MKTSTKWLIGVVSFIGLGGLIGVGVYEEKKNKSAPTPPSPSTPQLTLGHRYRLTLTCPFSIPLPPPPVPDAVILNVIGIPNVKIVPGSFTVASGSSGFAVIFDYTGPTMPLPAIQAGGATACQTQLVDQGLSPVNVATQIQTVSLMVGLTSYSVQAKPSVLLVKPPSGGSHVSHIASIVPSSGVGTVSGNSVSLTGAAGTIAVTWSETNIAMNPPSTLSYTATITVS